MYVKLAVIVAITSILLGGYLIMIDVKFCILVNGHEHLNMIAMKLYILLNGYRFDDIIISIFALSLADVCVLYNCVISRINLQKLHSTPILCPALFV